MKSRMKSKAVFLALCMVVSVFALVSLPVASDESVGGSIEAVYDDDWMEEQAGIPDDADKFIQFNFDTVNAYHLGDTNVDVDITLRNTDSTDEIIVGEARLTSNDPLFIPNDDEDDGNTIPAGGGTYTFHFTIDIGLSEAVNTLYPGALTLSVDDMDQPGPVGANPIGDESIEFDIYVS